MWNKSCEGRGKTGTDQTLKGGERFRKELQKGSLKEPLFSPILFFTTESRTRNAKVLQRVVKQEESFKAERMYISFPNYFTQHRAECPWCGRIVAVIFTWADAGPFNQLKIKGVCGFGHLNHSLAADLYCKFCFVDIYFLFDCGVDLWLWTLWLMVLLAELIEAKHVHRRCLYRHVANAIEQFPHVCSCLHVSAHGYTCYVMQTNMALL